jgi:hypothetical protein
MKITRARDYRLYYGDRRLRLLDLSLQGGRALFGHTPRGLSTAYKNSISRGLYADFASALHGRACAMLKARFPGYRALVFPHRREAEEYLMEAGALASPPVAWNGHAGSIISTPRSEHAPSGTADAETPQVWLWRPFTPEPGTGQADVILPVIPQPGTFVPQPVMIRDGLDTPKYGANSSPILLAGLVHMLALMETADQFGCFGSRPKLMHQPGKHREALGRTRSFFAEEQWRRAVPEPNPAWSRSGPYLRPAETRRFDAAEWSAYRRRALDLGLLLPEHAEDVIIIPSMFSEREERHLRTVFSGGSSV